MDEFCHAAGINRKLCPSDSRRDWQLDVDGFLDASCPAMGFDDLLRREPDVVLIRGRPWLGKSYLFNAIRGQKAELALGDFVWETQLQDYSRQNKLLPKEWDEWKTGDKKACWLIDSLDEGELVEPNLWNAMGREAG